MFAHAGLVREESTLERGIGAIARLRGELDALTPVATRDLRQAWELRNMLDVGEAVTRSALYRTESRGAHFRIDHPGKDDGRWRVPIRVSGAPGSLQCSTRHERGF